MGQVYFEEAAVLHSLICHNDFVNDYKWDLKDLRDYIRLLAQIGDLDSDELCEQVLDDVIYGAKMSSTIDAFFAKKLIRQIVIDKVIIEGITP